MAVKKLEPESCIFRSLKDLKKIMKRRGICVSTVPASSEKEIHLSEEELFHNAMKKVREIKEFRKLPVYKKRNLPVKRNSSPDGKALRTLEEIVTGKRALNLQQTQEYVEWVNQEYRGGIIKKLREGCYSVQDTLDLHGVIIKEAEAELERFLKEAFTKGYRCIKIIHGRGLRSPNGPVLKKAVVRWLTGRYRKDIVAFVTARQCDGGLGALYVLLS